MNARNQGVRVPMDDSPDRARRTVDELLCQAHAPSINNFRFADDDPYHRPGVDYSQWGLHPDMQRPDTRENPAVRPCGSYSTSVRNEGEGKMTNAHTRRMVVDDSTEYDAAVRHYYGDTSRYRSGAVKQNSGALVNRQFVGGAESGYKEA
ncbi:hypothetical protein ACFTWH_08475 [Streptomyces sp. NPDC057011]|uniref:hypothetical protein n=1 Tax=unclassified Streptomyces TaxID=2593676 RepID=UPI00363D3C52